MTSQPTTSAAATSTLDPLPKQASTPAQSSPLPAPTGLLDLEKELTCSICTDILYQPLTLLDCLHTFCGSCLKEWFAWQGAAAKQKRRQQGRSASAQNLYTCPSCRASVRETRPNATVTTLLDMYLQANPTRAKTDDEKNEVAQHFKPGDSVIPPPSSPTPVRPGTRRRQEDEEENDRRLMDEVRQMSLRELERRGTRASRGEGESRRHERNRRRDEMIGTSTATGDRATVRNTRRDRVDASPRPSDDQHANPRSLEHQSSLRSLISSSELDSQEMEEEIMRQILEEGLLDGIDLSNIDRHDEDEISERIAQAYRRRQRDRERVRDPGARLISTERSRDDVRRDISAGPPSSYHRSTAEARSGQRSSSQGSSSSARLNRPTRSSSDDIARSATRSATDLSNRTEAIGSGGRQHRRVTSRERGSTAAVSNTHSADRLTVSSRSANLTDGSVPSGSSPEVVQPEQPLPDPPVSATNIPRGPARASQPAPPQGVPTPASEVGAAATSAPDRSCSSCAKSRIQYDLHYICSKCPANAGSNVFALCLRCYRLGKGCSSWYGFGNAAWPKFRQKVPPGTQPASPHFMTPERFVNAPNSGASDKESSYGQVGVFCAICCENANTCYWRCDSCNEGEWGFCNACVNQANHCTHPLLPVAWSADADASQPEAQAKGVLAPLPVHTSCNVCSNPIPPSNTRYHCPSCNDGDYDICSSCFHSAVSSGNLNPENGPQGWRKCRNGHRMLVIGFESRPEGQRRVVVENVVGGWQMRDEDATHSSASQQGADGGGQGQDYRDSHSHWSWRDTSSGGWKHKSRPASLSTELQRSFGMSSATGFPRGQRLPPAGGYGFKMKALWTRIPDESVDDELVFPKWAEITEILDINEDWCWGVYCRRGGLFPENFGRVVS